MHLGETTALGRVGLVVMFLVCAAVFFGVLLGLAWVVNRVVDGVADEVDEHSPHPRRSSSSQIHPAPAQLHRAPAELGPQLASSATLLTLRPTGGQLQLDG